ncbi:MAG: thioredoxin family protein [Caldisericia bacterium]|nr:thioredoxin family protein [Caldisericia bacterium]
MKKQFLGIVVVISLIFISAVPFGCTKNTQDTNSSNDVATNNVVTRGSNIKDNVVVEDNTVDETNSDKPFLAILQELMTLDDKPIFIDLGSDSCAPCVQMEPIIEDLKNNYSEYFHTIFINVHENQDLSSKFGVQFIPTQIFFDSEGNEKYKHVGFFSKEEILGVLSMNGCDVRDK